MSQQIQQPNSSKDPSVSKILSSQAAQPGPVLIFNHKKVIEMLLKQQSSINELRAYFKSISKQLRKDNQLLINSSQQIQKASEIFSNSQIKKLFSEVSIWSQERENAQSQIIGVQERILPGLQQLSYRLKKIKQRSRMLQNHRQRSQSEIKDFRDMLSKQMQQFTTTKQTLIDWYKHLVLRNSTMLLQKLTNKMINEKMKGGK